jgi:hypothetical protein
MKRWWLAAVGACAACDGGGDVYRDAHASGIVRVNAP